MPLAHFLEEVERDQPARVAGTGVFLAAHIERVPLVLQRHLTHNKVLQREVILPSSPTRCRRRRSSRAATGRAWTPPR